MISKTLKGKAKTKVDLKIYRKSTGEFLDIRVKRGSIEDKSVKSSYMLNDSLGYIKLDRFASTTYFKLVFLETGAQSTFENAKQMGVEGKNTFKNPVFLVASGWFF